MRTIHWLLPEKRKGHRLVKMNWKYPAAVVLALKEYAAQETASLRQQTGNPRAQVGVVSILVTHALQDARLRRLVKQQPGGSQLIARWRSSTEDPASTPKPSRAQGQPGSTKAARDTDD